MIVIMWDKNEHEWQIGKTWNLETWATDSKSIRNNNDEKISPMEQVALSP